MIYHIYHLVWSCFERHSLWATRTNSLSYCVFRRDFEWKNAMLQFFCLHICTQSVDKICNLLKMEIHCFVCDWMKRNFLIYVVSLSDWTNIIYSRYAFLSLTHSHTLMLTIFLNIFLYSSHVFALRYFSFVMWFTTNEKNGLERIWKHPFKIEIYTIFKRNSRVLQYGNSFGISYFEYVFCMNIFLLIFHKISRWNF